jgi:hypothetical protein
MLQSWLVVLGEGLCTLAERLFVLANTRRTLQSTSSCAPLCFRERQIPLQERAASPAVLWNLEMALLLEFGEAPRASVVLRSRLQSGASAGALVGFVLHGLCSCCIVVEPKDFTTASIPLSRRSWTGNRRTVEKGVLR